MCHLQDQTAPLVPDLKRDGVLPLVPEFLRRGKIGPAAAAVGVDYDAAYHELEDFRSVLEWVADALSTSSFEEAEGIDADAARNHSILVEAVAGVHRRIKTLLGGDKRKAV